MDTEQSNPFIRKISTNFHDAEDVELLNTMGVKPQSSLLLAPPSQNNSRMRSLSYRPLVKRNFSKAASVVSDQSYLGNINNVNDQLNDELTKLAQRMQMFDQKSVSDIDSQTGSSHMF